MMSMRQGGEGTVQVQSLKAVYYGSESDKACTWLGVCFV